MTEKQLTRLLKNWQRLLRIQDWNIKLRLVRDSRWPNHGLGSHSSSFQESEIKILDPRYIDPDWFGTKDIEVTLVHELLHIKFLYARKNKENKENDVDDQEEFAIESLARVLVALRRGITMEELD